MNTDRLFRAHSILNAFLTKEGYNADCRCRSCDAFRPIDEARKEITLFHSEMVSRENPSPESQAQARSQEVGSRKSTLAVAQQIESDGFRFALWRDGKRVLVGYIDEIARYCQDNKLQVTFITKR